MEVFIPEDVRKKNPLFSELVKQIELKCFSSNFQEETPLWRAKSEWLYQKIVYASTLEIFDKVDQKILDHSLPEIKKASWEAVSKCFYLFHCCECVSSNPNCSILDLNPSKIVEAMDNSKDHVDEGKKLLSAEVEKHLELLCLTLANAHDGLDLNENSKIQHARALQIGDILKNDKLKVKILQQQGRELLHKCMDANMKYYQNLQESSSILMKLVMKYILKLQPHKDQILIQNAIISCQTFASKLKSIRMDLKCETYSSIRVEALDKLRSEILLKMEQHELQYIDFENQLAIYNKLGSDFEAVAAEYGNVNKEIEKQSWALQEIKDKID